MNSGKPSQAFLLEKPSQLARSSSRPIRPTIEQREESRIPASASVGLVAHLPQPYLIQGQLLDRSGGGFRVRHDCTALSSGNRVEFWGEFGSGQAIIVWTRVTSTPVESGCEVLRSPTSNTPAV